MPHPEVHRQSVKGFFRRFISRGADPKAERRAIASTSLSELGWHPELIERQLAVRGGQSAAPHLLELERDLGACYKAE